MARILAASRVTRFTHFVEKHCASLSFILVLLVLLQGFALSIARPLWHDELFTATFARFRDPAAIANAVRKAADPIPPAFYILEGGLSRVIPVEPIALRLPAVIGAAAAAASLFALLLPAVGGLGALIGTALLFITSAFTTYAAEARPYGLLLGCTAAAALAWRSAHKSWAHAAILGCCLTLASAIHYYAVFVLFAFLLAEVWLAFRSRRLRILSFVSICMSIMPLILQWPFLNEAREVFMPHFWGKSRPRAFMEIYEQLFPHIWIFLPVLSALLLLQTFGWTDVLSAKNCRIYLRHRRRKFVTDEAYSTILLGACLSLFMPIAAVVATWLMRGGFSPRYILPAVLGVAISLAFCSSKLPIASQLALFLAFCLSAGIQCAYSLKRAWKEIYGPKRSSIAHLINSPEFRQTTGEFPLVFANAGMFLEASMEGPQEVRNRIFFVANRKNAVRITGTDSVDVGLIRLGSVVPLRVIDYEIFRRRYRHFYVLSLGTGFEWLVEQLVRDGCQLSLVRSERRLNLFRSECNTVTK